MKQALISFLLLLAFNLQAQIIQPNAGVSDDCGPKIKKSKVMVLDIESFGEDREASEAFIREHAGEHRIVSATPENILTSLYVVGNPSRKTAIKSARRQASKRGCDLVIVLRASTFPIGSIGTATSMAGVGDSKVAIGSSSARMRGTATVLMGDRS
jgi:hypothetical protein